MSKFKLLLEGISPERYEEIKVPVNKSNRNMLILVSILAFLILIALGIISAFFPTFTFKPAQYLFCSVLVSIILIASLFYKNFNSRVFSLICSLFLIITLTFGMFLGIFDDPSNTSTVFMVLLLSSSLLFTLKPYIVDSIIIFMSIVFVIAEYNTKTPETFFIDSINLATFAILSIFICTFSMRSKLARISSEEKNNELLKMIQEDSVTDALTGLKNRTSYEHNFNKYPVVPKNRDFVYVSLDLNGLKVVNDTLGHAAGDEMIKGAANCMKQVFSTYGNLYRIGGDEFVMALFVTKAKFIELQQEFQEVVDNWHGEIVDNLSIALGYASVEDYPELTVDELSKISDKLMYSNKGKFYELKGNSKKGRQEAHTALCNLYTKILKIDINNDVYQIIKMESTEQDESMGFSSELSSWLKNFATTGQVHPDDLDNYLKKTDLNFMREHFDNCSNSLVIFYKRKFNDEYKKASMEIIPTDTYSKFNRSLFLYVRDIIN